MAKVTVKGNKVMIELDLNMTDAKESSTGKTYVHGTHSEKIAIAGKVVTVGINAYSKK